MEKIMTLHPDPDKAGVNISKDKYEIVRKTILQALDYNSELTFKGLTAHLKNRLSGGFEGSVPWYVTTVKLDLEARGQIERIPGSLPQRLRLTKGNK